MANLVTESLSKVYGNTATETPLIDATLNTIFTILAERGLPLAAAQWFVSDHASAVRDRLVAGHPDPYYRALGETFSNMQPREYRETVASTERRLRQFIGRPIMRRFFSQTKNTIDWRAAMDGGDVLLFNLKQNTVVDARQLRALGMMLTGTLVDTAYSRDPRRNPRPFYLYIDEVQNFVTNDIDNILSECSKFGLFVTASHQYIQQLRDAGDRISSAIMANTLLKALFSMSHQDAMEFVDEAFGHQIDPERLKEKVKSPHVVGHRRARLASGSTTYTIGKSNSTNRGTSVGVSDGRSATSSFAKSVMESIAESVTETYAVSDSSGTSATNIDSASSGLSLGEVTMFNTDGDVIGSIGSLGNVTGTAQGSGEGSFSGTTNSYGTSRSRSRAQGTAETSGQADTVSRMTTSGRNESSSTGATISFGFADGWSEALQPIIEWFSTQTWSIEEQRYLFAKQIARAPKRQGHFVAVGHGTIPFQTRNRPDLPVLELGEARLLTRLRETSGWFVSTRVAIDNADDLLRSLGGKEQQRLTFEQEHSDFGATGAAADDDLWS